MNGFLGYKWMELQNDTNDLFFCSIFSFNSTAFLLFCACPLLGHPIMLLVKSY